MHSEKKLTKEDTWRPADLTRHIRGDDNERRPRGGESVERRRKEPEKVSRQARDQPRELSRDKRHEDEKYRYSDRRKEGSRDRRGDKDQERKDDREKKGERDKSVAGKRYDEDYKRRDREDKQEREKDKERRREKERNRERDQARHNEGHGDKRAEDGEKERRTEERDKEHTRGERDRMEKHEREKRDRHRERERERLQDEYRNQSKDRERRDRHGDKKDLHAKDERERTDEKRRHKEERERRHREREYKDEKRKHDSESRENQGLKGSGEEVRRHRGDRERAQRDKHKDRRQREEVKEEEEKPERNPHGHEASSEKPASDKSHKQDTKTEVATEEVSADQEYEDDFEDYEEDFEELDESASEGEDEGEPQHPEVGEEREELSAQRRKEIQAIQRAMDEENERVGAAQSRQTVSTPEWSGAALLIGSEKNPRTEGAPQRGKFIDFVTAKQREVSKKVSTKQKKRSTELLRLIDLDFSTAVSLLDLPPVNEYDMYIRTFGTANTEQAYVQCNEDNADRDIQTEEIEMSEKWTQHPPEHKGACGDPNLSDEAGNRGETSFDSQRLTAFLRSASQVMVILLEEDRAVRKSPRKLSSQTDTPSFSDGSLQLNTKLSFLHGRRVSLVHFSQVQRHTMMSVHSPTTKPSAVRLDRCTLICIWNIWEPSRPQKVLVYESEVQCCCFSPGKAILVFAGTSVGSVVLWDLREHAGGHYRLTIGEEEWAFRQPTFSTDAVMSGSSHFSSVTSVEVVPSTAAAGGLRPEVPLLASEDESSWLSFQLASLDEIGVLNFWVVVELPKANEAGSPTDLGLRPGGKVKLLHSSRLLTADRVSPRDAAKTWRLQTLLLRFLPTDSNHFFIGTNMGLVNHETSHGLKAPPKFYRFLETGARPIDVTSIHFSPFKQHLFLNLHGQHNVAPRPPPISQVGCGDGSIRLHQVSREHPVAEWKNGAAGEAVVSLHWTQTRPAVFCVLDAASTLHIWDLLKNDAEPVVTERMDSDRVTAMTVFGDSGQQNTYSGIALAHESGKIEMQYFAKHFTVPIKAEEEKLENMMAEAL
ncbi:cytoplasmic dynein 2 intermediate chain 1 isoform 2-T2 [Spinachia spinachia]